MLDVQVEAVAAVGPQSWLTVRSVYLAGPMRGYEDLNFPAFMEAASHMEMLGLRVFNPAQEDDADPSLPLCHYMARDLPEVCRADGVVVLPGWKESVGARLEVEVARRLGKPVFLWPEFKRVNFENLSEPRVNAALAAESARHPNSARFHQLLEEAGAMHDKKQQDYGSDSDPFANVRASENWGIPGWVGALVRLNDKVARLQAFVRKGSLANESAQDSMMDIAVYALIALTLYEEKST